MDIQRGATGLIVAIIVALAATAGGVGYLILKKSNKTQDMPATKVSNNTAGTESRQTVTPGTVSAVPAEYYGIRMKSSPRKVGLRKVDANLSKDQRGVYALLSGAENDASEYIQLPAMDPPTFERIPTPPPILKLAPGGVAAPTGPYSNQSVFSANPAVFYKDSQHVYSFVSVPAPDGSEHLILMPLDNIDPNTFELLNGQYAKDAEHVYIITPSCENGVCVLTLVVVPGADPASFVVFAETIVPQSDGTGSVTTDAIDEHYLYYIGSIVDTALHDSAIYKKIYGTPDHNGYILLP